MRKELIPVGTVATETHEERKYFYVFLAGDAILCTNGEIKIDVWYAEELLRRLRRNAAEIIE